MGIRLAGPGKVQVAALLLLAGIAAAGWRLCPATGPLGDRPGTPTAGPADGRLRTARAFKEFATSQGLHSHCGNSHEYYGANCFIADHPITLEETTALTKLNCGLTPAWRGIVWVQQMEMGHARCDPHHIQGHKRVLGNLVLAGDEALLNRIEELCRAP